MLSFRRLNLAVCVLAGLFISTTASKAGDPRLYPANTEILITVNVKQILNSELVKSKQEAIKQLKAALENPPLDEVVKHLKEVGFDPFTDLTSITLASPGTVSKDPKDTFVVVDGVFDAAKIAAAAKKAVKDFGDTLKISNFGTTAIYEVTSPFGDKFYLALVDKSLVVTGREDALKGAIMRSQGNAAVATKVKDLLKNVNDKQSLSVIMTGEAMARLAKEAKGADQFPLVAQALKDLQGFTGAITISKDINFQLIVGTKDEKTAQQMVVLAQGSLIFAEMFVIAQAKQDPNYVPVVEVLKTLKVTAVGTTATLTGSVTEQNLEKLIKSFGNLLGGFPRPPLAVISPRN